MSIIRDSSQNQQFPDGTPSLRGGHHHVIESANKAPIDSINKYLKFNQVKN